MSDSVADVGVPSMLGGIVPILSVQICCGSSQTMAQGFIFPQTRGGKLCEVLCHPVMIPDHTEISDFESSLADLAEEYGGDLDGRECFIVKGQEEKGRQT
jgi:hypothetical protein